MSLFRRRLMMQAPIFQYSPLRYVESTGEAYIDTGVPVDPNLKFYIKFADWLYRHASGLFGSTSWFNSLAYYYGTMVYCLSSKAYRYRCGENAILSGELTCTGQGCAGDFEMEQINDSNGGGGNITLFRGGQQIVSKAKILAFKIWDKNRVLVRNFIPVQRKSDNEIGMYDLVNNQFYKSVNDQKFTGK